MTRPPSSSHTVQRSMRLSKRAGGKWLTMVLGLTCLPALLALFSLQGSHRQVDQAIETTTLEFKQSDEAHQELMDESDRLNRSCSDSAIKLKSIYQQWRNVDEIPEVPSELIVYSASNISSLNSKAYLTVPRGKHQLKFKLIVKAEATGAEIETLERSYDLVAPASYQIYLKHEENYQDQLRQMSLELTCNSPSFEAIKEDLLKPMSRANWSSTVSPQSSVVYPNEYILFSQGSTLNVIANMGLLLQSENWGMKIDGNQVKIEYTLRLLSDSPVAMPAQRVSNSNAYDLKYLQRGRYQVLPKASL